MHYASFPEDPWLEAIETYFAVETDSWERKPLADRYAHILRILRATPAEANNENPILSGVLSLSKFIELV